MVGGQASAGPHPYGAGCRAVHRHLDQGSSDILIENNVAYLTGTASLMQNYGRNNTVWKERGNDATSVIPDPEFVAVHLFNFALRPGSPAWKNGFQPIDLSTVGPRPGRLPKQGLDGPAR